MFKLIYLFLITVTVTTSNKDNFARLNFESKICNSIKLEANSMDAVNESLAKVLENISKNGRKTLDYSKKDGNKVYSKGVCYNNIELDKCKECLKILIDRILVECNNSKGAQYMVKDCFIRYEFYPFL